MKKITVILLTYNRKHYLKYSLEAIIRQSYKDINILVFDNGSNDGTEEFIRNYLSNDSRILYVKNPINIRYKPLVDTLLSLVDTPFVMITHDDDIMNQYLIEIELPHIEHDDNIVLVAAGAKLIDENNNLIQNDYLTWKPRYGNSLTFDRYEYIRFYGKEFKCLWIDSSIIFRTSALKSIDYIFMGNVAENAEWFFKLNEIGKFHVLRDQFIQYRRHADQDSSRKLILFENLHKILLPYLERYCNAKDVLNYDVTMKTYISGQKLADKLFNNQNINQIGLEEIRDSLYENNISKDMGYMSAMVYLKNKFLDTVEYVIWGAGKSGQITRQFIDEFLHNFRFKGCIDTYKKGMRYGYDIIPVEHFSFNKNQYIFMCVTIGGDKVIEQLQNMGYELGKDFMLGFNTFH